MALDIVYYLKIIVFYIRTVHVTKCLLVIVVLHTYALCSKFVQHGPKVTPAKFDQHRDRDLMMHSGTPLKL